MRFSVSKPSCHDGVSVYRVVEMIADGSDGVEVPVE